MIILLNGPLGIAKSKLAEALTESIDACAMLSGDHLSAVNPPSKTGLEHLHSAIELLVLHHRRFGENLRHLERSQVARAIDECEFEYRTLPEERRALEEPRLGTPFDVLAPPAELVSRLLERIALPRPNR